MAATCKSSNSCAGGFISFMFLILFGVFLCLYETDAQKEKREKREDIQENPIEVQCVDGVKMWRDRSINGEFKQLFGPNGLPVECR